MIPLSYISQYGYCKRRVGLLMLEQQWSESVDTVKGSAEHQIVHAAGAAVRNGVHILTDMQVFSRKMNLLGKCDAVEATESEQGICLPFLGERRYHLYPIEYKHGKLREETEYELQLCGQAMCLEEMYGCQIDTGAVFYISSHRRKEIRFTDELRQQVVQIADALADMLSNHTVTKAVPSSKCSRCSLKDICLPDVKDSVADYMDLIQKDFREVT